MHYKIIIITNLPAFYKVNLFNKMAERAAIFVIFTGADAAIRNRDFTEQKCNFPYRFLQSNSMFGQLREIIQIINKNRYQKLIIGGWDHPVYFAAAFNSPKGKNELIMESSYLESQVTGPKAFAKRIFLSRISRVLASGESQKKLMSSLHFKGEVLITKGVGLFKLVVQPPPKVVHSVTKFLYVGRLSSEKNIEFLIQYFNTQPGLHLNIIGYGPEEERLKGIANNNIYFIGPVDNEKLPAYYQNHEVFILPSLSETWGLVVEEALNNGLPVLLSKNCGIYESLRTEGVVLAFNPFDMESLNQAVKKICEVGTYRKYQNSISKLDFQKRADRQVQKYLQI